jgi:hypothetical protein
MYYWSKKIKGHEMGWACDSRGRHSHKISVGKTESKKSIGRPGYRFENTIKM